MVTVILHKTSSETDIAQYTDFIDISNGDSLIVLSDDDIRNKNIIELYNKIVSESDAASDIFLLSDCVLPHGNLYEKMRVCLHATEKHAMAYGQEIEDNKSLIKTAKKYLPEYSVSIKSVPCCVLIKRRVINTLGFLDISYESLQYALQDYYCRINIYGFSAIVSHHALFSCTDVSRKSIQESDKELFSSRHTHWEDKEKQASQLGSHPCLEFLEALDDEYYPKKRILFDCIVMPAMHCGTSEYQKSVFEAFNRLYGDKYDIYLYVHREVAEYHKLTNKYDNIIYPDEIDKTTEKFHLGFAPNQLVHYEHQLTMNKLCLKNVQTMFDIMMVRIDEHFGVDVSGDVELGIRMCDGITFISNFTKNDFLACYVNESSLKDKLLKVIYLATGLETSSETEYELPFDEYFLIVGNSYKHKAVREAVDAVIDTRHNYICVGYGDNDYIHPNVYSYKSGHIEDEFLSYLYTNCKAVIFPSLYEGFGLPLVIGFKNGKRVIVNNSELNNELLGHFSEFKDNFIFFDDFEQIGEMVDTIDFSKELTRIEYSDTWDRVAIELESFFEEIMDVNVDVERLRERWQLYNLIEKKMQKSDKLIRSQRSDISSLEAEVIYLRRPYELKKLIPLLVFASKTYIRNRHQWMYRVVKKIVKK